MFCPVDTPMERPQKVYVLRGESQKPPLPWQIVGVDFERAPKIKHRSFEFYAAVSMATDASTRICVRNYMKNLDSQPLRP